MTSDERGSAPQHASPRGTFLKIAEAVRIQITADPGMTELPSAAELMRDYGVSRGVALRVFGHLRSEGLAEAVPGARWRVIRDGRRVDRRPLAKRMAHVIVDDGLPVGAVFPSESALCDRFGVSRPTVRKALAEVEAIGLVTPGGQGKQRTVRTLPKEEERSET
ncbi:GntR family transcriptional regulator [Streptomyces sp. NPDC051569]|uniref:GntR family transcriptional regulator n=1 Tax=Streptomyces sp. NPDC051569 TaxID=3365661 RepID=UPI0037929CF7